MTQAHPTENPWSHPCQKMRTEAMTNLPSSVAADQIAHLYRASPQYSALLSGLHAGAVSRICRHSELTSIWLTAERPATRAAFAASTQLQILRDYALLVEAGVPMTCAARIIGNFYDTTPWFQKVSATSPKVRKVPDSLLGNKKKRAYRRAAIWSLMESALSGEPSARAIAIAVLAVADVLPRVATETSALSYAQRLSLVEKQLANKLRLQ